MFVFTTGVVRKCNWDEHGDSVLVGGASLISHYKGDDPSTSKFKWSVGEGLLQFDVDLKALVKGVEYLNVWFSAEHPPPLIVYIFSANMSPLQTANPWSKFHQAASTMLCRHLHKFFKTFLCPQQLVIDTSNFA